MMAKIQITKDATKYRPEIVETIEARVWGLTGTPRQQFYIGSGVNWNASGTVWLELRYAVGDENIFYTRNFIQLSTSAEDIAACEAQLDLFLKGEDDRDKFGFGDILPETNILLQRKDFSYDDQNGEHVVSNHFDLTIAADVATVFSFSAPGERFIEIRLVDIPKEEAGQFMRDLIHDLVAACQGKHPDPACLPEGSSDWPFANRLNRTAYNHLSETYSEGYFERPLLSQAFNEWLGRLNPGSTVLDAGCGHGDPVIARLLEKGYKVAGTDISPDMLRRAAERFPAVTLMNQSIMELKTENEFDAACSFSSLLYLDPIDLSHGIYRLFRALKPGGLLFLFAFDLHSSWRGSPYDTQIEHWMWSWTYDQDEVARALEEHGYFQVLETRLVDTEEEKQERIERRHKWDLEDYEEMKKNWSEGNLPLPPPPDLTQVPTDLAYSYTIIAKRMER